MQMITTTYPLNTEVNDCEVNLPFLGYLELFRFFLLTINPTMQIKTTHNPNIPPAMDTTKIVNCESVVVIVSFIETLTVGLIVGLTKRLVVTLIKDVTDCVLWLFTVAKLTWQVD